MWGAASESDSSDAEVAASSQNSRLNSLPWETLSSQRGYSAELSMTGGILAGANAMLPMQVQHFDALRLEVRAVDKERLRADATDATACVVSSLMARCRDL